MKKLFYVLVLSAAFAACNNESASDKKAEDTMAVAPVATDAAPVATDAAPAATAPAATDAAPATTAK